MPAASNYRVVDCARQEWAQSNDVFAAIRLSCKNCVGTAIYEFLSLSHRYAMPAPPSGGAKERTVVTLPSSDDTHRSPGSAGIRQRRAGNRRFRAGWSRLRYIAKARLLKEGADAVGGRRDNAHSALCRLTGSSACGAKERTIVTLPSSDDTHRRPCCAGFRQRGAGIRRIRTGWSRAASSTRLLKGRWQPKADGRRDNVPTAFPRTPYPRKNPAPRSWNSASETPSSSSRCAFGSSAGTPNSSCIL